VGREDQLIGRELELAMFAELVEDAAAGRPFRLCYLLRP
jgi:hypothetical protein